MSFERYRDLHSLPVWFNELMACLWERLKAENPTIPLDDFSYKTSEQAPWVRIEIKYELATRKAGYLQYYTTMAFEVMKVDRTCLFRAPGEEEYFEASDVTELLIYNIYKWFTTTKYTCAVSDRTIEAMEKRGASGELLDFATRTQFSMDPKDVVVHRQLIEQYNKYDDNKHANNFVMHGLNYRHGDSGPTSAQAIAEVLAKNQQQTGQPVFIAGPNQYEYVDPALHPFVRFTN